MRINTNTAAMNTYSRLTQANGARGNSMAKLSSGLRINRAGDDAAGLSISEKMRNQVSGLKQASRNAQDGISLIQTAEGALNETHSILNRMRDLAVQGANGTLEESDREAIMEELTTLADEINNIAVSTKFNGISLLDNADDIAIQIGADTGATNKIDISMADMTSGTLAVDAAGLTLDADDQDTFNTAIGTIQSAIETVSEHRSELGANQNRLEHTINNLTTTRENLDEANSRIRDVDMAEEMMEFTKNNILSQASTAMLAQANQMPQGVLQLLG